MTHPRPRRTRCSRHSPEQVDGSTDRRPLLVRGSNPGERGRRRYVRVRAAVRHHGRRLRAGAPGDADPAPAQGVRAARADRGRPRDHRRVRRRRVVGGRPGAPVLVPGVVEGRPAALAAAGGRRPGDDPEEPHRGRAVSRSLWLVEALAADAGDSAPPAEGAQRADVVIVGGGYTGLWTALHLKEREPGLDVVIVEADICGGGASGRNGGFVLSWWPKLETLMEMFGEKEGIRLAWASDEAVKD